MTTLILTLPRPAARPILDHFGERVVVCTKGHSAAQKGEVAETHFYDKRGLLSGGGDPSPLDIEMIAGCLARLMVVEPETIARYSADIYRTADAFLTEKKIDAVLFRTGPHLPHEMAIHQIAQRDGLRMGMYEETSYFGRAFLFPATNLKSLSTALWQPEYPYKLDAEQAAAIADSAQLKKHYFGIYKAKRNRVSDIARSALYSTLAVIKANYSGSPLAGTTRPSDNPLRPSLIGALGFWQKNISGVVAGENAFARSTSPVDVYNDLGPEDVVFYGNYAPERTIFPDSYPFHDFLSAMRLLGDFGKKIWREHPTQFTLPGRPYMLRGGYYKGPAFYEAVQREGWIVGPLDYPSEAIQQSSAMIATLNGTVAFEAMLKRRPLIAFAKNWYLDLPNVSTAGDRRFDLDYDPLEVSADAFARTFPRIDFWHLQDSDLDVLSRSIDLVKSQAAPSRKMSPV